ncbi:MAG: hypothetical protein IJP86_10125 [Synergistaceae bacterium]|nr:hypothetical protein [Synergistaceae bacterium]
MIMPEFTETVTLDDISAETCAAVLGYERLAGTMSLMRRGEKVKIAWLISEDMPLFRFINDLGGIDSPINLYSFYAACNVKFPPETVRLMCGKKTELDDISDLSELLSAVLCRKGDYSVILSPGHVGNDELGKLRVKLLQQFVMNYSAHLTDDEMRLFSAVYGAREGTVIIALNKIDEMYSSEVVKSYERAADYIASRLNGLGYDDFVIVPVSALTAVCAREIGGNVSLRGKYKGTDKAVMASFTENIIDTVRDFHGLEISSPASLEETGRISYLMRVISGECRLNPSQVS